MVKKSISSLLLLACESAGQVTPFNCLSQCDVTSLGYARSTSFGAQVRHSDWWCAAQFVVFRRHHHLL